MRAAEFRTMALVFLVSAVACDSPSTPGDLNTPHIIDVSIDSTAGPIFRTAVVRLSGAARVELTYGAPGTPVLTIAASDEAIEHRVLLPRLRASREYALETAIVGGAEKPRRSTFRTGALPSDVAAIQLIETGTPSLPVAMLEIVGSTSFYGLLIVEGGEIVGYLPSTGSLFGSTRRVNGDIVLLDGTLGLVVRRLDGTIIHRLPQPDSSPGAAYGRIHHDVTATPSNTVLFIANENRSIGGETVVGEALWDWNPEAGTIVRRWSAFDHLDWQLDRGIRSTAGNWLHGNSIAFGPRGNVLMSMRNADLIVSIAPDFTRLEWKLGGPTSTLIPDGEPFLGQHHVSEPTQDRVMVYDNGFERGGASYTRVVEYRVDRVNRTATRIWQYRPQPDIYSALVGSAFRLANGNTVITFGMAPGHSQSSGPLTVVEVDSGGVEKWRLTPTSGINRLYRLRPVASVSGEKPGQFASQ